MMDYNNNNNNNNKRLKPNNFGQSKPSIFGFYHDNNYKDKGYRNNYFDINQQQQQQDNYHDQPRMVRKKNNNFNNLQKQQMNTKQASSTVNNDKPLFSRLFILYPREAAEADLNRAFQKFGTIQEISIIKDQNTQVEKGIVYIKFAKASEAMMAMEEMHGKYLDNFPSKALNVLLSQDGNRNFKSNEPFTARLYVKIEKQMNRYDLKNMFKKYGEIQSSFISLDRETKESKGFGFVTFVKSSDAARALEECDPCFNAKFSFSNNNTNNRTQQVTKSPERGSDFDTLKNTHINNNDMKQEQCLTDNFDHLFSQDQHKEKENLVKFLSNKITNLVAHNNDMNNNEQFSQNFNLEVHNPYFQKIDRSKEENGLKSSDKDARVVTIQKKEPEIKYPIDISNEKLESNYVLRFKSKANAIFLKSIFNLVPGLKDFKAINPSSLLLHSDGEYIAKYSNDLITYYAMQKLKQIEFPSGDLLSIEFVKESDLNKKDLDNSNAQILVLIECQKYLTGELLQLIMNQFKNLLHCAMNDDNKTGFAIFSNEQDANLAVNTLHNREIAFNLIHAHIETNFDNFLFKTDLTSMK